MKIQHSNSITPQFKAYKIAQVKANINKNQVSEIDILSIHRNDLPFIKKLEKLDFSSLFPDLAENLQQRWKKILDYCIMQSHNIDNQTFLAVCNNKPCGIITFQEGKAFQLDGICSLPQAPNKKVPFVGNTLFFQLFKSAQNFGADKINLDAVTDGPFDVVKKYEELGFKKDITSYPYTKMQCNKYQIKEQLKNLSQRLSYIELKQPEKISLETIID